MGSGVTGIYCRQARPFNQRNGETALLLKICRVIPVIPPRREDVDRKCPVQRGNDLIGAVSSQYEIDLILNSSLLQPAV